MRNIILIMTIVTLITSCTISEDYDDQPTKFFKEEVQIPSVEYDKTSEEITANISLQQIMEGYKENEVRAALLYDNKIMYIDAGIDEFGRNSLGNPYVIMACGGSKLYLVRFFFKNDQELGQLNEDDYVRVKCKISGKSEENVVMTNCVLVEILRKSTNNLDKTNTTTGMQDMYDITEDYYENEFFANEKYKGKFVKIEGFIQDIKNSRNGIPQVILKSGNYYWEGLSCELKENQERILYFSKGDIIQISGVITGNVGNSIKIKDCNIIEEWGNAARDSENSDTLITEVRLIGNLAQGLPLPYKNEEEWKEICKDWEAKEACELEADSSECSDLYLCFEIAITNKDFKEWHNVEIIINNKYLVALNLYGKVAPKYKTQPNAAKFERMGGTIFTSTIPTCLYGRENCLNSNNFPRIDSDLVNYEKYNSKLCDCAPFTFAKSGDIVRSIRITADEGTFYQEFNH